MQNLDLRFFSEFPPMKSVVEDFYITHNNNLGDVAGFLTLTHVGRNLIIADNDLLPDFDGFEML